MEADLTAVATVIAPSPDKEGEERYGPFWIDRNQTSLAPATTTPLEEVSEAIKVATGFHGDLCKAHRTVASQTPDEVRRELYEERARLVRLQADGALRPEQERRLRMVEWQLDRIKEADAGKSLDRLALALDLQERFAKKVALLVDALDARIGTRKVRSPQRRR